MTDPAAAMVLARVRAQLEFEAGRPADSVGILLEWAALPGPADPGAAEAVLAGPFICCGWPQARRTRSSSGGPRP